MNIEINLMQALPEIILAVAGILVLLAGQFAKEGNGNLIKILSLAGLFIALSAVATMTADAKGAFVVDTFFVFFKILFISASIIVIAGSFSTLKTISESYEEISRATAKPMHESEYYSLILFITLGMCVVASARELILLFVGIELAGISSFILAAYTKKDRRSSEAGIKYLTLQSIL